jgi:nucleoporin GLE1
MQTIAKILLGALEYPGEHVDPQMFILDRPAPDSTAKHNGATMPLLFVYLLNIFAKAIVAQLISEASAKPAAAEPIGVLAHQIFSQPEFQWRNASFIDILLAKYRFACPVIFGLTGNEKTDAGRNRVGWKNDMGTWVSPQEHNERMIGLGAGYAALTLRNYGKSTRKNPYSPYHYWTAIATIVNTDPDKVCATQFTVLKAMIENHADKFISFYGDMAVAALRVAVISFPACAKETTIAVKSLQVLAEKWQNENGFFVI